MILNSRHLAIIMVGIVTSVAVYSNIDLNTLREFYALMGVVFSVDFTIARVKDKKGIPSIA